MRAHRTLLQTSSSTSIQLFSKKIQIYFYFMFMLMFLIIRSSYIKSMRMNLSCNDIMFHDSNMMILIIYHHDNHITIRIMKIYLC